MEVKVSKKEKKYRVESHEYIGCDSETGFATYKITFNQSLVHTGRVTKGIADGLNAYCKKERKKYKKERKKYKRGK